MNSRAPILYEFPHSHFCEVARWCLDHKGVSYVSRPLLPGFHARKMRKISASSSLPVLVDDAVTLQGSTEIVDYLEDRYPANPLKPSCTPGERIRLEDRIAETIAVPLRRLCYAHLIDRPDLVRYFFMHRSSLIANGVFALTYPILRRRLRDTYDCTAAGAITAQSQLQRSFDEFDRILAGREYLDGERFSRLDISFASLAVFMVMPPEYPVDWPPELAAHRLSEWFRAFADRPAYQHVVRMYRHHRGRPQCR